MAIYLVRIFCRETLPQVGGYFGINNYSTVSSVIERVKYRKVGDKSMQKAIENIGRIINKSQKRT